MIWLLISPSDGRDSCTDRAAAAAFFSGSCTLRQTVRPLWLSTALWTFDMLPWPVSEISVKRRWRFTRDRRGLGTLGGFGAAGSLGPSDAFDPNISFSFPSIGVAPSVAPLPVAMTRSPLTSSPVDSPPIPTRKQEGAPRRTIVDALRHRRNEPISRNRPL